MPRSQNGVSTRERSQQAVAFRGELGGPGLEVGEGLLETADVGGGETRLFTVDVVADGGVALRVLVDRAVELELCGHVRRLRLELGDLVVEPEQLAVHPFHARLSVSPGVAYAFHDPYNPTTRGSVGIGRRDGLKHRCRKACGFESHLPHRPHSLVRMTRQVLLPDRVFDSIDGVMLDDHAVVISEDRIEAVVPADQAGDSRRLSGLTALPGLIDVHTHLTGRVDDGQGYASLVMSNGARDALIGVKHAAATVRAGFTTVRDIGSFRAFTDVALREAITGGWVEGPRMMVAGAYVTCPGGGGDITGLAVDVDEGVPRELRFGVTSGVDQMRSTVRQILRYGADFIKVLATGAVLTSGTNPGAPEFTEAELRAAVETATDAGTFVAAHAHGAEGIKRAARAGVRSIEHGSLLDAEGIDLMLEHGTYLVADLYDGDYILGTGPGLGYSDEVMEKTLMTTEAQREGFRAAVKAGVRVAYGTDAGVFPHGDNAIQLGHYVEHGLTPAQALQSATRWAAELMRWEDRVGSLQPGSHADLLLVSGDPLADFGVMGEPAGVMKDGAWVVAPRVTV